MDSSYIFAWLSYLFAVGVAQLLLWQLIRRLPSVDVKRLIQVCVLAVLITPVRLTPEGEQWVPAFMAALMEGLDSGTEAALERLWPIFLVMLCFVAMSMLWRLAHHRKVQAANPPKGSGPPQ